MIAPFIVAFLVAAPSFLLIRLIERVAARAGTPLPRWRRLLIPVPIILLLTANLEGVLSLHASLEIHPYAPPFRYSETPAGNSGGLFLAGITAAALLPFFLIRSISWRTPELIGWTWAGHLLWLFFPFFPLLLVCGVPLRD